MNNFRQFLSDKNFTDSTISSYCFSINKFEQYAKIKRLEETEVNYQTIVKYITYLRKNNSDKSISSHLTALKHYFNCMGLKYNPVKIHLKRSTTLIGTSTLSKQELNQIYHSFTLAETLSSIRNKVLFGLFIFQGIRSKEIKYINCDCVDMQNACIVIPQGNKTNERILPLDVQQVLLMHRYLTEIRPRILGSRKSELLIVTQKEKNNIKSILNQIYPSLKKLPLKPTLQLIRISVIKNWLAENDLRTVQYMAGHRYISTTENYVTPNLKELKKNIEQCHPMNS